MSELYNTQAEAEILAAVLFDNDNLTEINLKIDDFFDPKHRLIYKAMLELFEKGAKIDATNLAEVLKNNLQNAGGISYLANLITIGAALDKSKIKLIKEKSMLRKLQQAVIRANDNIKNKKDFESIYNELQSSLINIDNLDDTLIVTDDKFIFEVFKKIEENAKEKKYILGYPTGLVDLDKFINGLQSKRLYVIAGRPGMGKSALSLNIAHNLASKFNVLYYSLEMTAEEIYIRRMAMESLIDMARIERGLLDEKEWQKLSLAANRIHISKMSVCDKEGVHINEIRRQAKKYKMLGKLDALFIDHIGIMNKEGLGETLREQITNICIQLKNIAKELEIPVIALSQLSRAPEARSDKRPNLSDLKESSGIEENADVVMLLYRDEYYNPQTSDKGIIEVNVAKQRGGKTGVIKLAWKGEYQIIRGIDNVHG